MTPKEKAEDLVNKFMSIKNVKLSDYSFIEWPTAKYCALIAVDEIINCSISYDNYNATWASQVKYWQEVKQEIEAL